MLINAVTQASPGPWAFGWDAVAAISTFFGAVGTVGALIFLYRQSKGAEEVSDSARDSARAAQLTAEAAQESAVAAREEATGAWRPILATEEFCVRKWDRGYDAEVQVTFRNVGRGPALSIRVEVFDEDDEVVHFATGGTHAEPFKKLAMITEGLSTGILRGMRNGPPSPSYVSRVEYRDLGGQKYTTITAHVTGLARDSSDLLASSVYLQEGEVKFSSGDGVIELDHRPGANAREDAQLREPPAK